MKVDYCLILAAGLGTRMGPIGKDLPKPLFPLFEKRSIDLAIAQARSLGINKIFINAFHQTDLMQNYLRSDKDITLLIEKDLLDIGGAVHNLLKYLKENQLRLGKLLIINGDQYLTLTKNDLDSAGHEEHTLLTIPIGWDARFNHLNLDDSGFLTGITKSEDRLKSKKTDQPLFTYSGNSIINLEKLTLYEGPSNFFKTVANFKEEKIRCQQCHGEYWDFGTLKAYSESIIRLIQNPNSELFKFLTGNNLIDNKSFDFKNSSYNAPESSNVFNFSQAKIEGAAENPCFIFPGSSSLKIQRQNQGIYWQGQWFEIE